MAYHLYERPHYDYRDSRDRRHESRDRHRYDYRFDFRDAYDGRGTRSYSPGTHSYSPGTRSYSPLSHRDPSLDQVGDYVARRLVPELQRSSDRPVQLVMNFGTLYVGDDSLADASANAIVYNAPRGNIVLGSAPVRHGALNSSYQALDLDTGPSHGMRPRRTCSICRVRRAGLGTTWCHECEMDIMLEGESGAGRKYELDYIRYPKPRPVTYVPARW